MRKHFYGMAGLVSFILMLLTVSGSTEALAQINFNVSIGPPPVLAAPPDMVLVPGSQVYYVPQANVDIFFYNGWWWAPRGDRWYRSRAYNGPWGIIGRRSVPGPVFGVPRDYHRRFDRERHMSYGEWNKGRSGPGGVHGQRGQRGNVQRGHEQRGREQRGREQRGER